MKKWFIALLLVSGGLFGLLHDPDPVPSEEVVVGLHNGTDKGYVDQIELTRDHEFYQILRDPNSRREPSNAAPHHGT